MLNQIQFNLKNIYFRLKEKHNYHLVDNSQLPIVAALASLLLVLNIVFYFHASIITSLHFFENLTFDTAWFIFTAVLFFWFLTVVFESGRGYHTIIVRQGLRYGMILFIVSEIMFFFAFFWAFFHVSLSPSVAMGGVWPPKSIQSLDVWGLPLVNTLLLLSSGLTITFAHRALLQSVNYTFFDNFNKHLLATILLGITFLCCQFIEYKYGITFRWKENVYGSTFFVTTGFHGLHVTIGTIFLIFCFVRSVITASSSFEEEEELTFKSVNENHMFWNNLITKKEAGVTALKWRDTIESFVPKMVQLYGRVLKNLTQYPFQTFFAKYATTKDQHLGFEAAAWYWHFVDVVWIFLFITIYWWGS